MSEESYFTLKHNPDPIRYFTQDDVDRANRDGPSVLEGPGWYFYDETWCDVYGPYKTEEEARRKCKQYADNL